MVPINDCERVEKPNLNGASQSFRVKICAGDLLVASITSFLADDCPVQCGVPVDPQAPTEISGLAVGYLSVYLS
jgi:hypothetical protein